MAMKEQTNVGGPMQEPQSGSVQEREARREDARAAFNQQGAPGTGSESAMPAKAAPERLTASISDGVTNVTGGVISVVRDTANTAIDGVGSIGQHAVHTLTGLLVGVVDGVRQVAGAAVGGVKSTAQEAFRGQDASRREQQPAQVPEEFRSDEAQGGPQYRRESIAQEPATRH